MNRRGFAKLALVALAGPLAFMSKLAASTPREQEIYTHTKLGKYKSHEIFRVQTPRFNGWATQLDFSHMDVEWRPAFPHYDNMLINYEHGSELYYIEGHDEPFNKIISKMPGKELLSHGHYLNTRIKNCIVFGQKVFHWAQRYNTNAQLYRHPALKT